MAALAEAGVDDLTIAQSRLLQRLAPTGMRLTDLAEQARITKQTASALVGQLEKAGHVVRKADPSDARARLVTLSSKGTKICEDQAAAEVARVEKLWRMHLGDKAFDSLSTALVSLREITDPYR